VNPLISRTMAAVAVLTLTVSDRADAQVTFTPAPSGYTYAPSTTVQPYYPYTYPPTTTQYRSSRYVAPGTTYVTPGYAPQTRYTTTPYNGYYPPTYTPYGQAVSPYGYNAQQGYYPNNNAVNLTIPGLGNIGFGRR
jgi:hypothetical protein